MKVVLADLKDTPEHGSKSGLEVASKLGLDIGWVLGMEVEMENNAVLRLVSDLGLDRL